MDNFQNEHIKNTVFIAKVTGIRLKPEVDSQGKTVFGAGTIDVLPPTHRMGIRGVRVICPNTAQKGSLPRGSYWLPAVGDWVVCGYLEGYPDHAICFGSLYHPTYNLPPEAALAYDEQSYQMNDIVFQHKDGSYIRLRNKIQPYKDANGTYQDPADSLNEITISHPAGDKLRINEDVSGQSEFTYTHNTGTEIKIATNGTITLNGGSTIVINKNGNIVLTPASGQKTIVASSDIRIGSSGSSEHLVLGDAFKTWIDNLISSKLDTHTHPTGVGPSGPPLNKPFGTMPSNTLSTKAKTE